MLVVALCGTASGQSPPTADQGPPSQSTVSGRDPKPIARWIARLNADQFLDREEATEQLVLAGIAAIEPLVEHVRTSDSVESRVRTVFVLKQIALSDDEPARDSAAEALERIVAMRLGTPSQNAAQTLNALSLLRQRRALDELLALGAKTVPERIAQVEYVEGLEFGEAWRGTDQDLRRLRWMRNVRQLVFSGDRVRDGWLEHAGQLTELNTLTISRAPITPAAAKRIARIQSLKLLELKYVPIGDDAVADLVQLAAIDTMKLYGTAVTVEGGQRLRAALPLARIDIRAGAFLGISGDHHTIGCLVGTVRPNTAASRAGLQPGDVVVTYEGERVGDFDALTALISKNRPGNEVTLQYVRDADSQAASRVVRAGDSLGITGQADPLGCRITALADNSLASQLDLAPGDVVHRIGTELVTSPEQLQRAFEQIQEGNALSLEFSRGLVLRTAKATLGEWE